MNRVRFGLTGLAVAFLSVLTAAALFAPSTSTETSASGSDPLATLGVAPGSNDQKAPPPRAEAAPLETPAPAPVPMPELAQEDPLDAIPLPDERRKAEQAEKDRLTEI